MIILRRTFTIPSIRAYCRPHRFRTCLDFRFFSNEASRPTVALVFDTETTGIVHFKKPYDDPSQPQLVQLGMILVNTTDWKKQMKLSILNKDVTKISEEAQQVHGISEADCNQFGVPLSGILQLFHDACDKADCIVAHNMNFDRTVLQASFHRAGQQEHPFTDEIPQICTMASSTDVLKLPGRYNDYKWPSLEEAYSHFMGGESSIENAHDALVDTEACLTVFRGLLESGATNPIPKRTKDVATKFEKATIEKKKSSVPPEWKSTSNPRVEASAVVATPGELNEEIRGMGFQITGNTYKYRHYIKSLGGTWNPQERVWGFSSCSMLEPACKLVGIPVPTSSQNVPSSSDDDLLAAFTHSSSQHAHLWN